MRNRPGFWLIVRRLAIELADAETHDWRCDALATWSSIGAASRAYYVRRAEKIAKSFERHWV